jgi:signal transduction histidine kinase
MSNNATGLGKRVADLLALCFLFTLLAMGFFTASHDELAWGWRLYFTAWVQLFLLAWALFPERGLRSKLAAGRFVGRLELQWIVRMYTAAYGCCALFAVVFLVTARLVSQEELDRLVTALDVAYVNHFLLLACPLTAMFMTAWQIHALRCRGLDLAGLQPQAYERTSVELQGGLESVLPRLEHHVQALASGTSAALPWLAYGKRPAVLRKVSESGAVVFDCTWTFCPALVRISATSPGARRTRVEACCILRGGHYKLELFVNAHDAVQLIDHIGKHVLSVLQSELAISDARERQERLRRQALEMQLRVLQAQVEPHFLFNTLANLRQLYRTDIEAGEEMLDHLIAYLRSAMDDLRSDESTVARECDLVQHFLSIMKVRMGGQLSYTFIHYDDVGASSFPPAMLISLVENAIRHGLRNKADGQLRITAAREDGHVRVSVIDNGPGISSVEGTGLGLSNIRQRLEAIHGQDAWLEVGALASGGFIASIVVPDQPGHHLQLQEQAA